MNVIIIAVPQMGLHYYFLQLYTMYNMGDIADWIFKICRRPREQFTSWQGSSKLVGTARNLLTHCLLIRDHTGCLLNEFSFIDQNSHNAWTKERMLTYRVTWLPSPFCDTVLESR